MADALPEDVHRFIAEHIHSVEQMEALVALRRAGERAWDATALGRALYTTPEAAGQRLKELAALRLLETVPMPTPAPAPGFRYQPATPELARLADDVIAAYEKRRVTVISLIYSKPHANVQAFADAFRLRKEK
jgi:hypothetical protein